MKTCASAKRIAYLQLLVDSSGAPLACSSILLEDASLECIVQIHALP